ncbi:MAG: ATP-grasp domain-containing protein [Caldilineaceae bacterium]
MFSPLPINEELKMALQVSTPEAETQRLARLRGRRILIVMGSYLGKRPMYERARALGLNLVVLDGPGHWTQAAVQEGLFEQFIEVDLLPQATLPERALLAVQSSGLTFDGVATFWELAGPLTAFLSQALGLVGHSPAAVVLSRNKIRTREACVAAGIPSPRFARIKTCADLDQAAAQVGFPAVLKPAAAVSSTAAYRVDDEQALHRRYAQTIQESREGLKTKAVQSDDLKELIWANNYDMILEAYLDGEEFDVDCLLCEGELVYACVIYNLPQLYCMEVGTRTPAPFPGAQQAELVALTARCLKALGFITGAFHVEVKYTSAGPRLIEINARLGGGQNYQINKLVWGVDLVEQYLMTCLGLPIRPVKAAQPLVCIAECDVPCPASGVLAHADFLDEIARDPRVVFCKASVKAGQQVTGPNDGVPDWLGEVLVAGDTIEAASRALDELMAQVVLPIQQAHQPNLLLSTHPNS